MTEHERVIQQRVIQHFSECCDIAEANGNGWVFVRVDVLYESLDLLKAQEPVEPKIVDTDISKRYHDDIFKNYYCGNCGEFLHKVNRKDLFCSQCGRAVKWK